MNTNSRVKAKIPTMPFYAYIVGSGVGPDKGCPCKLCRRAGGPDVLGIEPEVDTGEVGAEEEEGR